MSRVMQRARWNGPFVVLLEQDRPDEPDESIVVGKDADDPGPALDLAVEPFGAVGRMDLRPVVGRKSHVGEPVVLGLVELTRFGGHP